MKELTLDGYRIRCRESGAGDPVLLVHGWTGSSYDWGKLIPLLAENYRVVAPDLLGFGQSDKPRVAYGLELYTSLLLKLADALGLDRSHLVGNSMGGQLAAGFALEYPARVRTLTLLDASGVCHATPWAFNFGRFPGPVAFVFARVPFRLYDFYYRRFGPYYDSSFLTPEDVRGHYHSFGNREGAFAAAQCLRHVIFAPKARLDSRLQNLRAPTLILWGRQDRLLPPAMSEAFLEKIPGARRAWIDDCGHCAQEEKPEQLRQILFEFWKDHEPGK